MNIWRTIILSYSLFACFSAQANAADLDIQGGKLHGASGIIYDDFIYSVEFSDGTLNGLFPEGIPDYTNTTDKAVGLMEALYYQVIESTAFDDAPQDIVGCSEQRNSCIILSPPIRDTGTGQARVGAIENYNLASGITDKIAESGYLYALSTSSTGALTFAVFTQVATVPEPETYAMFLTGLGLLGFLFRNKKSLPNTASLR